jgi:hypothetical protein
MDGIGLHETQIQRIGRGFARGFRPAARGAWRSARCSGSSPARPNRGLPERGARNQRPVAEMVQDRHRVHHDGPPRWRARWARAAPRTSAPAGPAGPAVAGISPASHAPVAIWPRGDLGIIENRVVFLHCGTFRAVQHTPANDGASASVTCHAPLARSGARFSGGAQPSMRVRSATPEQTARMRCNRFSRLRRTMGCRR